MNTEVKEEQEKSKKSTFLKNFLLVIIFLVLGLFIGIYTTNSYLGGKDDNLPINNESEWPLDITNKHDYQEQINNLYSIISGNSIFYSSKGITYSGLEINQKLTYIYNNLVGQSIGSLETLNVPYYGSYYCDYGFELDPGENQFIMSTTCTVTKIQKSEFRNIAINLFDDDTINVDVDFSPLDGKKCVSVDDSYLCGNINKENNITGDLESKFEITKVTLDKDDTIQIYDKGYLIDKRSNIINPNDGYDNYYLHSSDSNDYYYELKSADNLTFVHTFLKSDSGNYYYAATTLLDK